jgi:hypothetical protein
MSEESLINDVRNAEQFKGVTFSGYKKSAVVKQLTESIQQGKLEPSCYWSAELICSGHLMELWETIISSSSKNIHTANPLLFPYLELRLSSFREMVRNGYAGNEIRMRNNSNVRRLFAEIVSALALSRKSHAIQPIKISKDQFDIIQMSARLKAPSMDYASPIYKSGDPKELFVPLNECAYHISEHSKNSMMACYWVEWIIEFDSTCRAKKENCLASRRTTGNVGEKYEKDVIWLLWDLLLYESDKRRLPSINKIIKSLTTLFSLRYSVGVKKRRRFLLYFAVSLLTTPVNFNTRIFDDQKQVDTVLGTIDSVYKQIKKNEQIPSTDYLMHGISGGSNVDKTARKLEAMNSLGMLGIRK